MNRQKKLIWNTGSSLLYQVTAIICGFILPRLILSRYGSNVNGLVHSIAQFLNVIAFLDLGVGAVIQSTLYKPLAERDLQSVSRIVTSGQRFFRRIALILLGYVVVLTVVYPFGQLDTFDFLFTALLILAMSISLFAQYYFGIVDRLLLIADQHGFIPYFAQTITLILNTVACVIEFKLGASIQIVKLTTSLIFLSRPLILRWYVNRKYKVNRKIKLEGEPIKQKWNGLAQHIASIVLDGTDVIVLTVFSTLTNVSIYSVYHLVVHNIKTLFVSLTNGIQALMGELWAKQDEAKLRKFYGKVEWTLHTATIYVFGCTAILILPFVQVYTKGIQDANYWQPAFAYLITAANAGHCLRLTYNIMILSAGHFKQTQRCYIIATVLNLGISIICVFFWGLIGVAIGTLVAMVYQTIWMAIYNSKNLLKGTLSSFLKQVGVDLLTVASFYGATIWIKLRDISYLSWIIMAAEVAALAFAIVAIVNLIFYRQHVFSIFRSIFKKRSGGRQADSQ